MSVEKKSLYLCKSCNHPVEARWTKPLLGGYRWETDKRCAFCNAEIFLPKDFTPVLCPHCNLLVEKTGSELCIHCNKSLKKDMFVREALCPHCGMTCKVPADHEGEIGCPHCGKAFTDDKIKTVAVADEAPQLVMLPDRNGLLGGENKYLIKKHPVSTFSFKSRLQVNEGTWAVMLKDGACKFSCTPGSYLLGDTKLNLKEKFDVAFADGETYFTTNILCGVNSLPAVTFGFRTVPLSSAKSEDKFTVACNATIELAVSDAQAFAAFADFSEVTFKDLGEGNGKLIVLLRNLANEVMQQYLLSEFSDKDPKHLLSYQFSAAEYLKKALSDHLQRIAGLKATSLMFNNDTPAVTFESNPHTALVRQAQLTRPFTGKATVYMPGHPEQSADIRVSGQYALDVVSKDIFFGRPEAQYLEEKIKNSQLPEEYQSACEDYFSGLISADDISSALQREAQYLINSGVITDLRDENQYLTLSGRLKMGLDEKLRFSGLGVYNLTMALPVITPSQALADMLNLPEKKRRLRNAVQEPIVLTTEAVQIHAPNDHSRSILAVFKGQCNMTVADENTFFTHSTADDFLHKPAFNPQEVTAKYASLLNPLFGDVLRSLIQGVVDAINADIRDINILTANVKSSIIASMSMRAGVYGLQLASVDMLPTTISYTSPTLLQQGSVESAISGDELRRKLEKMDNDHIIFTAQEDGRVHIAKNGVKIDKIESDDAVQNAESTAAAKAADRKHTADMTAVEHGAALAELTDAASSAQKERDYTAELREYKHKYALRDAALEQRIHEADRVQDTKIELERRERENDFAKVLEQAENKKSLNDILRKIDESDLTWQEKLDQYARLQKRTALHDDAEAERLTADTDVYKAGAQLNILREQDKRFFEVGGKKIELSASQAELIERIKQYDEDRRERITAANDARAERRSTLAFEQQLQDRREQVALQMQQLKQQYDQVLALRDKDKELAELQVNYDKYALQIDYYNNLVTTKFGADVAMYEAQQAAKSAEALYEAEKAAAFAEIESKRMDAQIQREDSIAQRAEDFHKEMMDILTVLELARIDVDKTRVVEGGKVGVEKARTDAAQAAAEKAAAEKAHKDALDKLKSDQAMSDLLNSMKSIRDSVNSLRKRVNKIENASVHQPGAPAPAAPVPPQTFGQSFGQPGAGFKRCRHCNVLLPMDATYCTSCYKPQY